MVKTHLTEGERGRDYRFWADWEVRLDLWRAQKQAQEEREGGELMLVTEMDCEADRQGWVDQWARDGLAFLVLLAMMLVLVWVGFEAWDATLESHRAQVAPYVRQIEQHGGKD